MERLSKWVIRQDELIEFLIKNNYLYKEEIKRILDKKI